MGLITDFNAPEWLPEWERKRREEEARRKAIMRIVGVDLGQQQDFTAISAIESTPELTTVYGLERMRGVPYIAKPGVPSIVARVQAIMALPQLSGATLVIDRTGVGRPVFDAFVAAGLKPVGISISGGNKAHRQAGGFTVPKRDLVFSLVALFQGQRLKLPTSLPEAAQLVTELQNFKMKINANTAHDSYEAWRDSDHDDLVLALAIATWYVAHTTRPQRKQTVEQRRGW